jgi:hypothetical protein
MDDSPLWEGICSSASEEILSFISSEDIFTLCLQESYTGLYVVPD